MLTESLILFLLLAVVAEVLGTVGGFGSSLFFVPLAGYFLDFHSVLAITALFHLSSNIFKILLFRKGVDKKLVLKVGIPAVIFVFLGAYLTRFVDTTILEITLALLLITVSIFFIITKDFKVRPNTANAVGGGIISGFFAGIVGTGGAFRGITLAAFNLDKFTFVATSAIIDLGIDSGRSIAYFLNGYVQTEQLYLIPLLMLASAVGTLIGKKILERISERQFRSIVLLLILATGIITLYHFSTINRFT